MMILIGPPIGGVLVYFLGVLWFVISAFYEFLTNGVGQWVGDNHLRDLYALVKVFPLVVMFAYPIGGLYALVVGAILSACRAVGEAPSYVACGIVAAGVSVAITAAPALDGDYAAMPATTVFAFFMSVSVVTTIILRFLLRHAFRDPSN
ncbi:MAG: hypothetical protein AAF224_03725 [Pseudomonadota bacterium]